jgi:hypothetical protein
MANIFDAIEKQLVRDLIAAEVPAERVAYLVRVYNSYGSIEEAEEYGKVKFATAARRSAVIGCFTTYARAWNDAERAEQQADATAFRAAYRAKHGYDYGSN